jgi:predicted DNA-binding transcriptional regulator YafY
MTGVQARDDAVVWFEIPAREFERTVAFYEAIFATSLRKIEAVLPAGLRDRVNRSRLYSSDLRMADDLRAALDGLHAAIDARRWVGVGYARPEGGTSRRDERPLGLFFWGGVWTLGAWRKKRSDFRTFLVNRMSSIDTGEVFRTEPGRGLAEYLAAARGD